MHGEIRIKFIEIFVENNFEVFLPLMSGKLYAFSMGWDIWEYKMSTLQCRN